MHESELKKFGLLPFGQLINSVSRQCTIGTPSEAGTDSFVGGLPAVESGFTWPVKDGYPLHFIGQFKCRDLPSLATDDGCLLFFYDNRHWGNLPTDRGHAVVLHQDGEHWLEESDLPQCENTTLFGLRRKILKPRIYQRVYLKLQEGRSYPSLDRESIKFDSEQLEERYNEFCNEIQPVIQFGGYPAPIQSDEMERDCVNGLSHGEPQDWRLLLEVHEVGNMTWGDGGALYWFIHQDDLHSCSFDRVWMVSQCH